jgi:uncharacterized protein (DUF2141 family)
MIFISPRTREISSHQESTRQPDPIPTHGDRFRGTSQPYAPTSPSQHDSSRTFAAQSKPQTHFTIEVQLTQQANGELAYLIFASSSGFPGERDKALRQGLLTIPSNTKHLRIDTDLPPGTYAVSVYKISTATTSSNTISSAFRASRSVSRTIRLHASAPAVRPVFVPPWRHRSNW